MYILILIIIAINWQIGHIVKIYTLIVLIFTIISLIIRGVSPELTNSETIALAALVFVTCTFLCLVMAFYLWHTFLLPAILKWYWNHLQNEYKTSLHSAGAFPYMKSIVVLIFLICVVPLWLPMLLSLILAVIFVFLGVIQPFGLDLMKMKYSCWDFTIIDEQHHESGIYELSVQYTIKNVFSIEYIRNFFVKKYTYLYKGYVDEDGRPSGFGLWTDTESGGEVLEGYWQQGFPVGPFRSREQLRVGGTFSCVRIGFTSCSDCNFDSRNFGIIWRKDPIHGVSSVECCISGTFYRDFPHVSYLSDEKQQKIGYDFNKLFNLLESYKFDNDMESLYSPLNQNEFMDTASESKKLIQIEAKESYGTNSQNSFSKDIFIRNGVKNTEVMIFIPGKLYKYLINLILKCILII